VFSPIIVSLQAIVHVSKLHFVVRRFWFIFRRFGTDVGSVAYIKSNGYVRILRTNIILPHTTHYFVLSSVICVVVTALVVSDGMVFQVACTFSESVLVQFV
jgi:hypothetical protein